MPLSPEAECLLLIIAANGGEMHRDDAERELTRVMALPPEARTIWKQNIKSLVNYHAERIRKGHTDGR